MKPRNHVDREDGYFVRNDGGHKGGYDLEYERFKKLLGIIFKVCDLAGYEIEGRISVKDKATGRVWR